MDNDMDMNSSSFTQIPSDDVQMAKLSTIIDLAECLADSPRFRSAIEDHQQQIDILESKLEKVVKLAAISVDSGKTFMNNNRNLLNALSDLQNCFKTDPYVKMLFKKLSHTLQEIANYQTMLIDQMSRIMCKNITCFLKNDVKEMKEHKQLFDKVSCDFDNIITRHAQVSKSKSVEAVELENLLTANRSCFRHVALEYVTAIAMFDTKRRHELSSMMLSFVQSHSTFFHQGSDLFQDTDPYLKHLGSQNEEIRVKGEEFEKTLENRHLLINQEQGILRNEKNGEILAGYLFKRTTNAFKTWNRRWFVLECDHLMYKKRSGEEHSTMMEEDLRLCTVRPFMESDRRYCFEILSPTKHHVLQAESEEVCNIWISSLQGAISNALSRDPSNDELVGHGSSNEVIESPNTSGREEKTGNKKKCAREIIYKIPGNDKCCDCSAANPEWASINIGITLCIECSGIHRSLGVHLSKVRSMVLDEWDPETVKVFAELGNVIVNRVYEAGVTETDAKPTPSSTRQQKEAWIKMKYSDKKFVRHSLLDSNFKEKCRHQSRRWSVRKLRRRPRSCESSRNRSDGGTVISKKLNKSNPGSVDVIMLGEDLLRQTPEIGITLGSDEESTEGESETESLTAEDLSSLDANNLLWRASYAHNLPVMCLALAMGGDKNWSNAKQNGYSPLHAAILSGSVMTCQYLILNGAKFNSQDNDGTTPLLLATVRGNIHQVCLLLKCRADQSIEDNSGTTPLSQAVNDANADIVTLLRLANLNDEMRDCDAGSTGDETFNAVVKDFCQKFEDATQPDTDYPSMNV